ETMTNTHEWCAHPEDSQIALLQNIPFSQFGSHREQMLQHHTIAISRPDDYPLEATGEREWMAQHGFRSLLFVPLLKHDRLYGAVGFYGETGKEIIWPSEFITMLRTVGNLILNILERKQADEALQKSEERLKLAMNAAKMGVWESDVSTGELRYEQVDRLLGVDGETLVESYGGLADALLPEDRQQMQEAVDESLATGKEYTHEFRLADPDGSIRWFESRGKPILDESGIPVRTIGTITDITDRKRSEEERRRLETQLQQSLKMEAIGTLSGGIAHDFNNILSIIVGNTDLASMDVPEGTPVSGNLREIHKASMRARDMVKQILAFSRQTTEPYKPLEPGAIVEESMKMLRASIPTTIEIRQDIAADIHTINGDATQINQILVNLCTNAAHAMRTQGGTLAVGLENLQIDRGEQDYPDLAAGSYVKLTVRDNGHGMDPERMERIFDPYFTTKEIGEGTGMGLSVVHGIVKNHGGAIAATSEVGKGTVFEVLLPVNGEKPASGTPSEDAIVGGDENILFVDDEPAMAVLYESMLKRLGYSVTIRTGSIEALDVFRAQPDDYDLVITDQTMPHMTGQMLAEEMMTIRPHVPVILCTGHSDLIDEDKAKAMGIRAFLMKPVVIGDMAETIRKALGEG
ncbi:MAG: ATP-binding protein, partial [Desulfobacterales bacterium]